jgi:hypothetical protein
MSDTSHLITFTRDEFVTSLRVLLSGFAEWTEFVFGRDLIDRPKLSRSPGDDFTRPGAAGATIERSFVMERMQQAYDFVTTGVWNETGVEEFACELEALESLCRIDLGSPSGRTLAPSIDTSRLPSPQQMCQRVLEHAKVRLSLHHGNPLELTEIALLAGLAEKTVRMAANPKGKDRLVIFKEGHRTFVEPDEALRWLSSKAGFHHTVMLDQTRSARSYTSLESLAWHCKRLRHDAELSAPALFQKLEWGRRLQAAYRQLEEAAPDLDPRPLTVSQLSRLGRVLNVSDSRLFAKNAALVLAPIAIELECAAAPH